MAQLIIDINDTIAADVRDALYTYWGGPNNPSNSVKMAFLKTQLAAYIKRQYREAKETQATQTAAATSNSSTATADIT
jgi:hypothetical protein